MELIYLILSVLLRISPSVRPLSDIPVSRARGPSSRVSVWLPFLGWVVVSVQRSASAAWLPFRVVAVESFEWQGTNVETRRQQESLTKYGVGIRPPRREVSPDLPTPTAPIRR